MSHDNVDCQKAIERLDDYVDRALNEDDIRAIETHLSACPPCAKEFDFERSVIAQIKRRVADVNAPADLKSRVLARLSKLDQCD